jgi:hypothetical protein
MEQSDIRIGDTVVISTVAGHKAYSDTTWFSGVVAQTGHRTDGGEGFLLEVRYRTKKTGWRGRYARSWYGSAQVIGKVGQPSDIEQLERMMK